MPYAFLYMYACISNIRKYSIRMKIYAEPLMSHPTSSQKYFYINQLSFRYSFATHSIAHDINSVNILHWKWDENMCVLVCVCLCVGASWVFCCWCFVFCIYIFFHCIKRWKLKAMKICCSSFHVTHIQYMDVRR